MYNEYKGYKIVAGHIDIAKYIDRGVAGCVG